MPDHLQDRWRTLVERLHRHYNSIGHSTGRPYVYFVYPPERERAVMRMIELDTASDSMLAFRHVDLLELSLRSIDGQEAKRQALLDDPAKGAGASESLLRIWSGAASTVIDELLRCPPETGGRPVVILRGTAALHPVSNPTALMEQLADAEPRDPVTEAPVPIVVLVPGVRPPQTSRTYLFLGLETERLEFYRGEEA